MKKFERIIGAVLFFGMLILGSIRTEAMTIEEGRHLFFREYRKDFVEVREEYGPFDLKTTEYGFVLVFHDEEKSCYSFVDYDMEQEIYTAYDWDYDKDVDEFDWKEMLLERAYELD